MLIQEYLSRHKTLLFHSGSPFHSDNKFAILKARTYPIEKLLGYSERDGFKHYLGVNYGRARRPGI